MPLDYEVMLAGIAHGHFDVSITLSFGGSKVMAIVGEKYSCSILIYVFTFFAFILCLFSRLGVDRKSVV